MLQRFRPFGTLHELKQRKRITKKKKCIKFAILRVKNQMCVEYFCNNEVPGSKTTEDLAKRLYKFI